MSLKTFLDMTLRWEHTSELDFSTVRDDGQLVLSDAFTDGVIIDKADKKFTDRRTVTAAVENLDLAAGLTDAFGVSLTFAKVKCIAIHNLSVVAGEVLKIGGHASAAFPLFDNASDIYPLGPNGIFFVWEPSLAGKPVTATTADLLKIDPGAATIQYDIVIIGSSS